MSGARPPTLVRQVEDLAGPWDRVYVSPHLDDVALSCAGTILAERARGLRVLVVTLFSAPWKDRPLEEAAAARELGVDACLAGLRDAPFRRRRFRNPVALFHERDPEDERTLERAAGWLTRVLERARPHRVNAPLGVGGHVDHELTFRAVQRALRRGSGPGDTDLVHYEDRPYSFLPEATRLRLRELGCDPGDLPPLGLPAAATRHVLAVAVAACMRGPLGARALPSVVAGTVRRALRARRSPGRVAVAQTAGWDASVLADLRRVVRCYGSQVPFLFGDLDGWERATREHAARLGWPGGHAERSWRLA